jgi:hypothetical protein
MADELPGRRLPRMLRHLASRLSMGESFESAIQQPGSRLPAHLRGLIAAGVRTGRLATVLAEFAAVARRQRELRRKAALSLAYPAILLAIVSVLLFLTTTFLADSFRSVFRDFGAKLPLFTEAWFAASRFVPWIVLALAIALMHVVLRLNETALAETRATRDLGRFAEQFRRDVHEAIGVNAADAAHRSITLRMPEGHTVAYRVEQGQVLRRAEAGPEDSLRLPGSSKATIEVQPSSPIVSLAIRSPGTAGPTLRIDALAAKDHRFEEARP